MVTFRSYVCEYGWHRIGEVNVEAIPQWEGSSKDSLGMRVCRLLKWRVNQTKNGIDGLGDMFDMVERPDLLVPGYACNFGLQRSKLHLNCSRN